MKTRSILPTLLLLLSASLLGGCELQLTQLSVAPPGAIADVDPECEEIELSQGVALGVACTEQGGPCEGITVSVADNTVADAFIAYSDELISTYSPDQATSFVVIGKRAGQTEVTVDANEGSLTYVVRVRAND